VQVGLVHWFLSKSSKSVKTVHYRFDETGKGGEPKFSQRPGKGARSNATSAGSTPARRCVTPGFQYSLFTAADEKIALSVVRVNTKPQYLVFGVHFLHTPYKHKDLRVESSKRPSAVRGFEESSYPETCAKTPVMNGISSRLSRKA
jgi:hypothetical protein